MHFFNYWSSIQVLYHIMEGHTDKIYNWYVICWHELQYFACTVLFLSSCMIVFPEFADFHEAGPRLVPRSHQRLAEIITSIRDTDSCLHV